MNSRYFPVLSLYYGNKCMYIIVWSNYIVKYGKSIFKHILIKTVITPVWIMWPVSPCVWVMWPVLLWVWKKRLCGQVWRTMLARISSYLRSVLHWVAGGGCRWSSPSCRVVSILNSFKKDPRRLYNIVHSRSVNGRLLVRSFHRSSVAVASYIQIWFFASRGCGYVRSNYSSGLSHNKIITIVEHDT